MTSKWMGRLAVCVLLLCIAGVVQSAQQQELRLNAMESPTSVSPGGWHMGQLAVAADQPFDAKYGLSSVRVSGVTSATHGMGNFIIHGGVAGKVLELSLAVRVDD